MSTLGEYDRCKTCGEFGWANRHTCPPVHECRMVLDSDSLHWSRVNATDAEEAAEKFVRDWFWGGGYEGFKDGERVVVEVRQGYGPIEIIEVLGEQTMEFNANKGDKDDALADAEKETAKAVALALIALPLYLIIEDEQHRKYTLGWLLSEKFRRAAFHYEHWCDLKGDDPDPTGGDAA